MEKMLIEYSQDNQFLIAKDSWGYFGVWVNDADWHQCNSMEQFKTIEQAREYAQKQEDFLFNTFTRFTGD